MTSLLPQLAPSMTLPESKSQMLMGGSPLMPTFFNLVPALNPIHGPSGEKKGYSAPSVSGRAAAWPSETARLVQHLCLVRRFRFTNKHDRFAIGRNGKGRTAGPVVER